MRNKFPERLKELREGEGISQKTFAKNMFVAQSTVAMWETGKREPSYDTLMEICDYFEVTIDYMLGKNDY